MNLEKFMGRWWGQLAIFGILIGIVFLPMLSGFAVLAGDGTDIYIPQLAFYKRILSEGGNLFWNSGLALGLPHFVTAGHPFNPFNLLLFLMPPIDAHYWGLWAILTLTLFFSFRFLRGLGIEFLGAFIGSLSYIVGNIFFVENFQMATPLLAQAVIFYSVLRAHQEEKVWLTILYALIGALAVAFGWLMGGYWSNLYIFLAALGFVVWLVLKSETKKRVLFRVGSAFLVMFLFGTIIGLLQIVPTYVSSQLSGRAGGLSYEVAQGDTIAPLEFFNFFHLATGGSTDAYLYMGVVPLFFLILSFFSKEPVLKFFRWLFIIALAIAVKYSPLFWLLHELPIFNLFKSASRFMLVGIFAASVMAGFGWQYFAHLWQDKNTGRLLRLSKIILIAIATVLVLAIPAFNFETKRLVAILFSLLFVGLIWLVIRRPSAKLFLLGLIAAADFVYAFYFFHQPILLPQIPLMISRQIYEEPPPGADFLQKNPGRMLWVLPDDFDNDFYLSVKVPQPSGMVNTTIYDWKTFGPNTALFHDVASLEAYDPLLNVEAGRLMALLGAGRQLRSVSIGGEQKLDKLDLPSADQIEILKRRLPLANFLGIKYLVTGYILEEANMGLIPASSVEFDFFKTPKLIPLMAIYENPNAKPIAYFSKITEFVPDKDTAYQKFKASGFKGVFVECDPSCEGKDSNGEGKVFVEEERNGYLKARTNSSDEQFLIFSQNYLPGWKAYVDGQEVSAYKVNTIFGGIFVPAGEHEVRFEYDYWSLFNPAFLANLKK